MSDTFFTVCLLSATLFLPAVIGYTLVRDAYNPLYRLAGWLTLEPIAAVPLWYLIAVALTGLQPKLPNVIISSIAVLPSAALTVIVWYVFRSLFTSYTARSAYLLLGLHCVRWLNTWFVTTFQSYALLNYTCWSSALLPTLFAIAAQVVAWRSTRA